MWHFHGDVVIWNRSFPPAASVRALPVKLLTALTHSKPFIFISTNICLNLTFFLLSHSSPLPPLLTLVFFSLLSLVNPLPSLSHLLHYSPGLSFQISCPWMSSSRSQTQRTRPTTSCTRCWCTAGTTTAVTTSSILIQKETAKWVSRKQ